MISLLAASRRPQPEPIEIMLQTLAESAPLFQGNSD